MVFGELVDERGEMPTEESIRGRNILVRRNLSTTLRHCLLQFTEQFLLSWMSRVD